MRINDKNDNVKINLKIKCYRCGRSGHYGNSEECPAKNQQCRVCNMNGHFATVCNTKQTNNRNDSYVKKPQYNNVRAVQEVIVPEEQKKEEDEYIFHLGASNQTTCVIGGITLEIIIDTGADVNIIGESDWQMLKSKGCKIFDQTKGSHKSFKLYASETPLVVLGSFQTKIEVNAQSMISRFYVIKNGPKIINQH